MAAQAVQVQYSNNEYRNWVQACLGLKLLKEGLVDYVDKEVKTLHNDLVKTVSGSATCNVCTTDDLTRKLRSRPCPKNVCGKIRSKIQTEHRYRNPQWDNTDATKWCTDHWEIAKCFMSTGNKTVTSPADTDITGILSVCINGMFMSMAGMIKQAHPPVNIFHKNREARNKILHSGSMSLSDVERQDYIQGMIDLLATYKRPVDHVTQEALDKLITLNTTGIVITPTDEVAAIKLAQEATSTSQLELKTKIETYQQDMQTKIGSNQQDIETKIDTFQSEIGHDLEIKIDSMKQEQDTKTERRLKLMDDKLLVLQTNTNVNISDISDLQANNKSLLERHDKLHESIRSLQDLVLLVKNLEKGLGEVQVVKDEVQDVKDKLQTLENVQKMSESCHVPETRERKKDIQKYLLEKYRELSTISMPPFHQRIKANIDDDYKELLIRDDLVHKGRKQSSRNVDTVENYQAILNDNDKPCKNIYVVGTAGIGKTTWSRKLVRTWCDVISKDKKTTVSSINKTTLQKYDFVFYLEMRRAKVHSHIIEMIENQLFLHKPALMTEVKTLLESDEESSRCLIVLDGLDEWVSRAQSRTTDGLPDRDPLWKSTFITTTRSWKLEELELEPQKIDRAVEIRGLQGDVVNKLVTKVVSTLNDFTRQNKDVDEFRAQCNQSICECMNVPLLLNIIVCLWYEGGHIDELLSQTFCGLVELLIKHAEGDSRRGQRIFPETLKTAKQMWKRERGDVPDCLAKRRLCSEYAPLLNRLGKIAFDHLFSDVRESTLVFNYQSISDIINKEELQIALDIGILSQTIHCGGSVLDEEFSLSFLHKTVQEYLAALYMVYDDTQSNACLNTYQEYCTDVYNILEMETVLMFVSGMCPEMAGKMSCHIATMERNEWVHKLLLRCVRQERIASSTSRQIYVKHHFFYSCDESHSLFDDFDVPDYNEDTVTLLGESKHKDMTLFVHKGVNDKTLNCMEALGHVKLVNALFDCVQTYPCTLDLSGFEYLRTVDFNQCISPIQLPTEQLENVEIIDYKPNSESVLDLSACKSLKTVRYKQSTAPIHLPSGRLKEIHVQSYKEHNFTLSEFDLYASYEHSTEPTQIPIGEMGVVAIESYKPNITPVLDLSSCKALTTVRYNTSKAPIRLPTEQLEEVEIVNYKPRTAPVLDLSGCKSARTVCYKQSTAPIALPTERLEEVYITEYTPNSESVLDLSGCKSLKAVHYNESAVPVQLPTEQLEKVEITDYKPSAETMLDLSRCKSLQTVCYKWCTAPIQLQHTEQLKELYITDYDPSDVSTLNLSGCKSLKVLHYEDSTAPIQLPTEQLEEVYITSYTQTTEQVLDLSGCKSLKVVQYEESTVPIQLSTEQLEKVIITDYKPYTKPVPVLDLSECTSLRTVCYRWSKSPIQLPAEQLEEIEITNYTPRTAPILDLSGCKSLKTVQYKWCTVPIQLPTEQLEKVEITDYKPLTAPVLDLSGCKCLRILHYKQSTVPIHLPTEQLENLEIIDYTSSAAPVLDLSGCNSLKTVSYKRSTALIHLPSVRLDEVNIQRYTMHSFIRSDIDLFVRYEHSTAPAQLQIGPVVAIERFKQNTVPILDLSGCRSLKTVHCEWSIAPIKLPTEKLEEVHILTCYTSGSAPMLDLSGCKSLKTVRFKQSTAAIQLPSEGLKEIKMQSYKEHTLKKLNVLEIKVDLSIHFIAPTQVSTEQLQVVAIASYTPDTTPVLDLSGCKALRTVRYEQSTAPIQLPTEQLDEVTIFDYKPRTEPVLNLSGCKSLRFVQYTQSSAPIELPTEQLKEVIITGYKPSNAPVLDLSGCKSISLLTYMNSSIQIKLPTKPIKTLRTDESTRKLILGH